jgi:PAS domain S-box-containing protein
MALLARLGVGAKLMLLVLLPVAVLLGVTIAGSVNAWQNASSLGDFRSATEQSFVVSGLATALADERTAAALTILHPDAAGLERLRAARADVDAALGEGSRRAAEWEGPVDLGGRLDAVGRQLNAVRVQATSGSLTARASADAYSAIVRDVLRTIRELDAAGPTRLSARAARAYVAIVGAIEAAERERVDVAALLATPTRDTLAASSAARWNVLETAQLDAFSENADGPLAAELEAVLFSPPGVTVTAVRDALNNHTLGALQELSLIGWLDASGTRIASLRVLEAGARENLTAAASNGLAAARADGFRDLGILLAVLLVVSGLGLALRWSITGPLREVSEGARNLSSGKLAFDIGYSGRDEIGQVASAFRDLHVTVERLAGEIREMAAAVRDNRLGHRADVAAFEGTWSQLLAGVNATMAAFADVEGRRERAERELGDFFELSPDLLSIGNLDGYFTRVNPAFERTLGYSSAELGSRPFIEFVHPDDRQRTEEVFDSQLRSTDVIGFENRYVCSDGSVRWLQWSARPLPAEGLVYAVARDVTERRRSEDQQATLRRVATLVAEGATPAETFSAVAAEVGQLVGADVAVVFRYEPERAATFVGGWGAPGIQIPIGARLAVTGTGVVVRVLDTHRPARAEQFDGPPGSISGFFQSLGARSGVGAPITVEGRLWGVLVVVSAEPEWLPVGNELGIADFTDLLATAIANAQARLELRGFADEQAALRRVATLVAQAAPPEEVFAAVTTEVRGLLAVDLTAMGRYDPDGTVTYVGWSTTGDEGALGVRVPLGGRNMVTLVFETGRPARIDDYSAAFGPAADLVRGFGTRAAVAVPISVEGRLWGAMMVVSTREEPLPADSEARLARFTELVATAIANAESQVQLTASRARIVAAADQARHRIERDLHDGAQQRLVSLVLQLRAAQSAVPPEAIELAAQFDGLADEVTGALDELRELARGIHPAALAEGGLRMALKGLARRSAVPVELDVRVDGRLPEQIETAAYYVVSEALANAAKHANASVVHVEAVTVEGDGDGVLRVRVRDDGRGGTHFAGGSGLVGLKDRVEALGGTIKIESPPGRGTALHATVPIRPSADPTPRRTSSPHFA